MWSLNHHVCTTFGKWVPSRVEAHPRVEVTLRLAREDYGQLHLPEPKEDQRVKKQAVTDTGAMMVVVGVGVSESMKIKRSELIPVGLKISTADSSKMSLLGAALMEISEDGSIRKSKQLVYVAGGVTSIFLSQQVCRELGVIGKTFASIGEHQGHEDAGTTASLQRAKDESWEEATLKLVEELAAGECSSGSLLQGPDREGHMKLTGWSAAAGAVSQVKMGPGETIQEQPGETAKECQCPQRVLPPEPPKNLPFPPTEENIPKLKVWIEKVYASSTFNQCQHCPLPMVKGSPPLRLYVDPEAKPVAAHKPCPIPVHFQAEVKRTLDRDLTLGVLEPVPIGTPSEWCSRMVVATKQNGKPRRTVDLKMLNRVAKRQTHPTESPFHQAMSIPRGTFKTVCDAWNGYHSIELAEEDRHFTTFKTPYGRYRYKVAPQGFAASGDGYTARFDEIKKEVTNSKGCVDDTILYEQTVEENFRKTCEFLTLVGSHGIILNKEKFQFCQKEVNYVGFRITENGVEPGKEMLEAIQDFPRPRDISGVRSFFGLIEQVSFAFSKTDVMAPFRHLLSPKNQFLWSQELQDAFDRGREEVVRQVRRGIQSFDMNRTTCLQTDYSQDGIGFLLLQKYCSCSSVSPRCCPPGWKLCYVSSRFLSPAETR